MHASLEFLLGLLDQDDPPAVTWDDWTGPHRELLRTWQEMGFVEREPGPHPAPTCPHCGNGVPYRVAGRCVCPACGSSVDPRHLLLWRIDLAAFLVWLAEQWKLTGGVRQIDACLWQLGTRRSGTAAGEFFFRRTGVLTAAAATRLEAYRQAVLLYGVPTSDSHNGFRGPRLCLLELLRFDGTLTVIDPDTVLRPRGNVRFDADTGAVWVGDVWMGEVPAGSKEFHFLACLAAQLDRFVPYADLKRHVLQAAGSTDGTEEATFC